jgi:hypothetical protein
LVVDLLARVVAAAGPGDHLRAFDRLEIDDRRRRRCLPPGGPDPVAVAGLAAGVKRKVGLGGQLIPESDQKCPFGD